MNKLKKATALVLVLLMILLSVPAQSFVGLDLSITASAESYDGTYGENLTWTLDTETGVLTISGEGEMWSEFSTPWRSYSDSITSVIIEEGVTSIGDYAFYDCYNLASVTIPNSVTSIGVEAFTRCENLASIEIPDSVTSIGDYVFYDCFNLASVTIPDSVTSIGSNAFACCYSLASIEFPDSVKTIGEEAFRHCDGLTTLTIGNGVEIIGKGAFSNCEGLETVTIGNSVKTIGREAFGGCRSLVTVEIPDSVESIGFFAFTLCTSLKNITIPASVKSLGIYDGEDDNYAIFGPLVFAECISLESITVDEDNEYYSSDEYGVLFNKDKTVLMQYPCGNSRTEYTIPESVENIETFAFAYCFNLVNIEIGSNVKTIGMAAFGFCLSLENITVNENNDCYTTDENGILFSKDKTELVTYPCGKTETTYTIPSGVKTIGATAFIYCISLESVEIPDTVESIGYSAFSTCEGLTSVTIPDSVKIIDRYAFEGCDFTSVKIGNSVESIGEGAFDSCNGLTSVTIPDSVKIIDRYAFSSCDGLTSVKIGNGVESIGDYSFERCTSLESIIIPVSVTSIGECAFEDCSNLANVYYTGSEENRENITISEYGNDYLINATWHYNYDATSCSGTCGDNLTWVLNFETGVLTISGTGDMWGYDAVDLPPWYSYASDIKEIIIEDGVTSIGTDAFVNCVNLVDVTIGNTVTSIGAEAFVFCTSLKSITIPNSVTDLLSIAFAGCTSLESIIVFEDNENYSNDENGVLFNKDKTELVIYPNGKTETSYTIPDGVTSIFMGAFIYSLTLKEVIIGNEVTSIGDSAFFLCTNLESVEIGSGVTSIGDALFEECTSLKSITVDENNLYFSNDENGVLFNKDKTELVQYPTGNERTSYTVPATVESIKYHAFRDTVNLTSVKISDGITNISDYAISDCYSLESIIIPVSVTNIGDSAFANCSNLADVYYTGSEEDRENITISDSNNDYLINATWHYNYDGTSCVHNYVATITAPTCTAQGYTTYTCSVCGDSYVGDYVNASGHSYSSVVTAPTCTTQGFTTYTCTCGDSYVGDYTAATHNTERVTIPSTCAVNGVEYDLCYDCKNIFNYTVLDLIDHVFGEWEVTTEPTYTSEGIMTRTCKNCGISETKTIEKLISNNELTDEGSGVCVSYGDGVYEKDVTLVVTPVYDGDSFDILNASVGNFESVIYDITIYSDGVKVQPNGLVLVKIPFPEGYDPEKTVIYFISSDGSTPEKMTSYVEDGYIYFETSHFSEYALVDQGNCKHKDTDKNCVCDTCETSLAHSYTSKVTAPTCTAEGYTTYTCVCGNSYVANKVSTKGHSYSKVVMAPTCTEKGYTTYTCKVCAHSYTGDSVNATGHSYGSDSVCDNCGKDKTENCSHLCHKSGFMGFIWKIVRFFWKLFKINPNCDCGIAHY